MYETPKLEKIGTLRDLTQSGGQFVCADAASPYARYPMA